jgi:soluble lytic murein transglycosylase
MIRLLLLGTLFAGTLSALSLDAIKQKPSGHVKNFLLWQYLKNGASAEEAETAFSEFENINRKLYMTYAKRSDDPYVKETARCWSLKNFELLKTDDDDCAMMALSIYKVAAMKPEDRTSMVERFGETLYGPWIRFITENDSREAFQKSDPKLFVRVANSAGSSYRRKTLNHDYSQEFMNAIANASGFSTLVKRVVTDDKMDLMQRALLKVDLNEGLGGQTAFFLALNHVAHGSKQESVRFLQHAYDKFYYRMDKDKALFWQFLITKETQLLQLLAQSVDINIYSLYANELLENRVDNYFIALNTKKSPPESDITDPFVWEKLLDEIRQTPKTELFDLAKSYRSEPMLPVQSFILERAYGYKMHGYITPYQNAMYGMPSDKKAVMLSLMRQESRFIPSALSRSYALGLMQMMPFLVKAMDKDAKRKTGSLTKMFDPETNIAYASKHLDYLQSYLYHPLFVAYAYNGGIGFTKRLLLSGAFSKGNYEPFWSMEMMANSESREYGKKVLANYVLYKRIFGEPVSIARLFDNLKHPSRSDRFRASR